MVGRIVSVEEAFLEAFVGCPPAQFAEAIDAKGKVLYQINSGFGVENEHVPGPLLMILYLGTILFKRLPLFNGQSVCPHVKDVFCAHHFSSFYQDCFTEIHASSEPKSMDISRQA